MKELTGRGQALLWIGAALIFLAIVTGSRDALRPALLILTMTLFSLISVRRQNVTFTIDREISEPRITVDGQVHAHLRLRADGRMLTGALLVEDHHPAGLSGKSRFIVQARDAKAEAQLHYSLTARKRGVHALGPVGISVVDPFGLARHPLIDTSRDEVVVAPRICQIQTRVSGSEWLHGSLGVAGGTQYAGEDDVTIREYQPGDDSRRVHWRTSARLGHLTVRREEQPRQHMAEIVIGGAATESQEFETMMECAASLAVHLAKKGYTITLATADRTLVESATSEAVLIDQFALLDQERMRRTWRTHDRRSAATAAILAEEDVDGFLASRNSTTLPRNRLVVIPGRLTQEREGQLRSAGWPVVRSLQ
jgi:uncharacterized protein (DUF58 family)